MLHFQAKTKENRPNLTIKSDGPYIQYDIVSDNEEYGLKTATSETSKDIGDLPKLMVNGTDDKIKRRDTNITIVHENEHTDEENTKSETEPLYKKEDDKYLNIAKSQSPEISEELEGHENWISTPDIKKEESFSENENLSDVSLETKERENKQNNKYVRLDGFSSDLRKGKKKFSVPFLYGSNALFKSDSSKNKNTFNKNPMIKSGKAVPLGKSDKLLGKFFGDDIDRSEMKRFVKRSEKLWFLEPDYDKFDLSFDMEGKVNGGTWNSLIEYLTPPGKIREDFNRAFMLTFRVFANGKLLTEALIKRYYIEEPLNLTESQRKIWHEKKQKPVQLKVFNIFLEWFENYWYTDEDKECLPRILQFFNEIKDNSHISSKECKKAINRIEKTLEEALGLNYENHFDPEDREVSQAQRRVSNISLQSERGSGLLDYDEFDESNGDTAVDREKKIDDADIAELLRVTIGVDLSFEAYKHLSHIAQIDPEDVASQLTILQSECYCKILPVELIRSEFSRKSGSKAYHVKQMSTWSNQISRWVAALILYEKTPEKRSRVIKYFLELALECLRLKNYDAVMAIQGALNSSAILRLKRTWNLLPRKSEGIIKKLQIATDPSKNYAQYRSVLRKSSPPLLPFLGLYLTDLTFICDGNPDMRHIKTASKDIDIRQKDILINFDKHYKVAQIITQIQKYQIAYSGNFTMAIPGLQKYILNQIEYWGKENYDDDKLYNLSLEREPRAQMNILTTEQRKRSVSHQLGFN
ncbi:hypothetical protein BB559_004289 [Furculomyces boomerangus]|uniref:Ras-GEF domain-containing protein n=1 Tax=Furculomyces boomerangus TaxID=61424 RepID=A0A2T9YFG5_9FUNG|nr:hypothetical protein BB559_004289 [Furculomyces boomerangus]